MKRWVTMARGWPRSWHSPFLLDALEHREVRLTTLADDGSVLCAPLGEHPSFARWKNLVAPGELWSSELEDCVRAGAR